MSWFIHLAQGNAFHVPKKTRKIITNIKILFWCACLGSIGGIVAAELARLWELGL